MRDDGFPPDDDDLDPDPVDLSVRRAAKGRRQRRDANGGRPGTPSLDAMLSSRRHLVMKIRLAGVKVAADIQTILKERHGIDVTVRTVQNDLMVLDEQFRETATFDRGLERGLDLERIEALVSVFLPMAMGGDKMAAKICVDAISLRVRVMGTEAAKKVEISVLDQVQQVAAMTGMPVERVHAMCQDILLQAGVQARLD